MKISNRKGTTMISIIFKDVEINKDIKREKFLFMVPEFAVEGEILRIFDWLN
jgi:hypothetical protein